MLKKIIIIIRILSGVLLMLIATGGIKKLISIPTEKLILALIGYALLITSIFFKKIKKEKKYEK